MLIKQMLSIGCLSFLSINAEALTLDYPLDILLDSAKEVVIVEIIEGRKLEASDGIGCFNIYTAQVTDRFKGGDSASIIKFGSQEGLAINKEYLVALNDRATHIKEDEWLRDYNFSGHQETKAKSIKRWEMCKKLLPERMVAAYGIAAMPIENPHDHGYSVKVPAAIIGLPPDTKCSASKHLSFEDDMYGLVWVKKEEMARILKEIINRPTGTKIFGPGRYAISARDCVIPNHRHQ